MFLSDGQIEVEYTRRGWYRLHDITYQNEVNFNLDDIEYFLGRSSVAYHCRLIQINDDLYEFSTDSDKVFLNRNEFEVLMSYLK